MCRYTQDGHQFSSTKRANTFTDHDDEKELNECAVCRADTNLWICLICGHVGCGRYDQAHAFAHQESSGHCFAMDMSTQRIWDYGRDGYVHRILQDKSNGKFMELDPSSPTSDEQRDDRPFLGADDEMVPQNKLHTLEMEYTALLTSQLESQRAYFEDVVARTADKASAATSSVDALSAQVSTLTSQLAVLQFDHNTLKSDTVPQLERELSREQSKNTAASNLARRFQQQCQEEQSINKGLLERVKFLDTQVEGLQQEKQGWEGEVAELKDQNRDLMMFLEGKEKVKELEGTEMGEEIKEGFVEVGESAGGSVRRKGEGKGKK